MANHKRPIEVIQKEVDVIADELLALLKDLQDDYTGLSDNALAEVRQPRLTKLAELQERLMEIAEEVFSNE